MASGTRTVDKLKLVPAFSAAVPSAASPKYVSMKGYNNCTIVILGVSTATVTGSAVTVNQAKAVNGVNAKALALDYYWYSNDTANSVALTQGTVTSNTFTTTNTANAKFMAILEVRADRLDQANGFDCLQVGLGNAVNSTVDVLYIMGNFPRYAGSYDEFLDPLTN